MTTFDALPGGVAADTAELIVSMPLTSDDEVVHWFGLVRDAYEAGPEDTDTERFVQHLRETAGALDSTGLEQFVQVLQYAGNGLEPVARVLEVSSQLPGVYWELYWQRYPAEPAAEDGAAPAESADRFDWVPAEHQARLAAAWGPEWATYLAEQVDHRWGEGWEANPAEHKQYWLSDLVEELLNPQADAEPAAEPVAEPAAGTAAEPVADDYEEVDVDELVEALVADSVAKIDGADELSEEDLAEVRATIRATVMEEIAR